MKRSAKKWGAVSAVGISLSLGVAQTAALAGLSTTGADPKPGDRAFRQMAQANAAFVVDREIEVDSTAPIPLSIILSESLGRARHEFIIIQGMPDDFKVSAGFRTKNNWFVPTMDLHSLHIIPPAHSHFEFSWSKRENKPRSNLLPWPFGKALLTEEVSGRPQPLVATQMPPEQRRKLQHLLPSVCPMQKKAHHCNGQLSLWPMRT